jgi:hypothetical protein
LVAADLVDGALRQADDVERVEADLGVRGMLADRFLVAAQHVDRDRADRARAFGAELVNQASQQAPAQLIPGLWLGPGFDVVFPFRRVISGSLTFAFLTHT